MTQTNQVAVRWRKSTHSNGVGGECVEVATVSGHVLIRDSKDPEGPVLSLDLAAARGLMSRLRGVRS
ncbi:protein of unknown function [Actinomadura meyerae]|uniref:DUF397 domain-containing protein n=1 Tax=Actinomadura meyerae TaxID=240840 RepID=A0A239FMJ8_9ACTN|nr:DUF397 domain-containing protein [Actinomadura meyerae]SNS57838.1 protein of unknown function [Actinomadura meyerae]